MKDRVAALLRRRSAAFPGSAQYWEQRYRHGGNSGSGSYGEYAAAKAAVVNEIVAAHAVRSVIEFGCGDGNQLQYLNVERYLGLDVAASAVDRCVQLFSEDESKSFLWYDPARFSDRAHFLQADLALSQEVIFHLVEDEVFEGYLQHLFSAAGRLVLICSSDIDWYAGAHERHRNWTPWVEQNLPEWRLIDQRPSPFPYDPATGQGLMSGFYLYSRAGA